MRFYKIYLEEYGPAYHIRKPGDSEKYVICGIEGTSMNYSLETQETQKPDFCSEWLDEACCLECFRLQILEELGE